MTPEALVIAGPNGSGKTTFAHEFLRSDARPFLSADLMAADLSPSDPSKARVEAGRQLSAKKNIRIRFRAGDREVAPCVADPVCGAAG